MSAKKKLGLAAVTVAALLLLVAPSASASFHMMRIRAFFSSGTSSFVELQMIADGQNLVNGQTIDIYPNTGTLHTTYILNHNVANSGNQRTILIGDTTAAGTPDFTIPGLGSTLAAANPGALCYSNIDCVSWGAFTNNAVLPSPAGTPLSGLSSTMVEARGITRGCPTALDAADDTNNSAADFSSVVGFPLRNNSVAPTETLCPTTTPPKKKCKKHKKGHHASAAKKKKCKKKHHHH